MMVADSEGTHHSASTSLDDTLLRLDSTTFGFDRATPNFENEKVEKALQSIGEHLAKLSDPIDIQIVGHTCDIGAPDYNKRLSVARAESVKNSILTVFGESEMKQIWEQRIEVLGYGEDKPLVENSDIASRRKNRRVEILLKFSSQFDYPACRSGMTIVEQSRKKSTSSLMNIDEHLVEALGSAFDLAVVGAAVLFPPVALLGVTKQGLELATMVLEEAEKIYDIDKATLSEGLNKLYHADITLASQLIAEPGIKSHQAVIMKAYLKRTLALNGLIRLLRQYQYEQLSKPRTITVQGQKIELNKRSFENYDIPGYINTFLLNDDWEVESGLLGPVHLDKHWLENKETNSGQPWQHTRASTFAQGRYVFAKFRQSDDSRNALALAKNHNRYFPIHYMSSESEKRFKAVGTPLHNTELDKSVFKHIIISARSPGATSPDSWQPFLEYYQDNGQRLSPYDHIRILVVLDKSKVLSEDDGRVPELPVAARAILRGRFRNNWQFFDNTASETVEYTRSLDKTELMEYEQKVLEGAEESVLGAIIQPNFYFGAHQIMGTRPVADYDDDVLKALFDNRDGEGNSDGGNDNAQSSRVSGAAKYLSYFYQVGLSGQEKTDTNVVYGEASSRTFKSSGSYFNLTLSPTREYKFTKDFATYAPSIKGDHIFYEETFLSMTSLGEDRKYPKIFDSPKVDFYLGSEGIFE